MNGDVAESVDAHASGACGATRESSTLSVPTIRLRLRSSAGYAAIATAKHRKAGCRGETK